MLPPALHFADPWRRFSSAPPAPDCVPHESHGDNYRCDANHIPSHFDTTGAPQTKAAIPHTRIIEEGASFHQTMSFRAGLWDSAT